MVTGLLLLLLLHFLATFSFSPTALFLFPNSRLLLLIDDCVSTGETEECALLSICANVTFFLLAVFPRY
jgi:hypothetical protein